MIIVYHNSNRVVKVVTKDNVTLVYNKKAQIATVLTELALRYPKFKIVWCNQDYENYLDLAVINDVFHHDKMMLSYNPNEIDFLGKKVGYIDESPFVKINKEVTYPTWIMSSVVGCTHAKVLLAINQKIKADGNFDYYLSSMAKICMPLGLLCYSEPKLLQKNNLQKNNLKHSNFTFFRFIKQHYRTRWLFLLFLNLFLYERKVLLLPLLLSLSYKSKKSNQISLDNIQVQSRNEVVKSGTIDVIIPTIGRKQYLYDVLKDLSVQTHLPENVIIIEQNPKNDSVSELDFLKSESWPFNIKHTFTHQSGACNARNLALSKVESEWVFLNDDDNRFDKNVLRSVLNHLKIFGLKSLSLSYLQLNEIKRNLVTSQSSFFGSGNSFVHSSLLTKIKFNMQLEFGYGEDSDFGMQIRNQGIDVIYFPNPEIVHLKAPFGGFRTKPILAWTNDVIQPKPSPTIMLYKQLHTSKEQISGYKTILFLKYYKKQSIKNPIRYFLNFEKQWKQSLYWANQLKSK